MKPEAPEIETRAKAPIAKRAPPVMPSIREPTRIQPPRVRTEHTREDFIQALNDNKVPEEDREVIKSLMDWSEGLASSVSFGDTITDGGRVGFQPAVRLGDKEISLFRVGTNGGIDIHFKDWVDLPPFDSRARRVEMLGRLNGIRGVKIPESKVIDRPPVPVRALRDKENLDKFVGTYHWFIGQARGQ
ncbi:MAG: hypothetical protein SA339_06115 [Methanomassiliicoccus sp.]|nr:hypothetical protein [Methanomassiliicoccus sp.]